MPPIGPVIITLAVVAFGVSAAIAIVVHALVRRFWLACAIITAIVLLGCATFHGIEGYRDALSIAMLYGIGGASGLALAILAGLPIVMRRRLRTQQCQD